MTKELNDDTVNEFLKSYSKNTTRCVYKVFMRLYLQFTAQTGQKLIEEKRNDKDFKVEKRISLYRQWLLNNGQGEYSATSNIGAVRAFYDYYYVPLLFRRNEKRELIKKRRTTSDYLFDIEDLKKMATVGDLKERYVLLVGKSLGLRAGDFSRITYGRFRVLKLDNEAPIAFGEYNTEKENVKAFPFLDSDAVPIVKAILEANKEKSDKERIFPNFQDNLSIILQTLSRKAGMQIVNGKIYGNRVRFHCLRKFLCNKLSAVTSESQWKQIVGKAIDEGAYISQSELRNIYSKIMKETVINGIGVKSKRLEELENALIDSQKRLGNVELINETLRREMTRVSHKVDILDKYIGLADVVETEGDFKKVFDFFENMRMEKELRDKKEYSEKMTPEKVIS
jgi:hypothetical protein